MNAHEHKTAHHFDPSVYRGTARPASQRELRILSRRRTRLENKGARRGEAPTQVMR